ncbi:MAG: peptidoglycan-binding protein [Spirulina sp.]
MDTLTYTLACTLQEEIEGIEYDFSGVEFFNWSEIPNAKWLGLLSVGIITASLLSAAPSLAQTLPGTRSVSTPKGGCLNARTSPSMTASVHSCVTNESVLAPIVGEQGDWYKLSTGRWVYKPYTALTASSLSAGGTLRQVSTPQGGCLNARTGPGTNYKIDTCVSNGATLKTVIGSRGDWLQLSSDRWVYGPYTKAMRGVGGVSLKQGSTGAAVRQVQQKLGLLTVDGIFGAKTEAAVKAFQTKRGLTVDGIVGPQTRRAMGL